MIPRQIRRIMPDTTDILAPIRRQYALAHMLEHSSASLSHREIQEHLRWDPELMDLTLEQSLRTGLVARCGDRFVRGRAHKPTLPRHH